MRPLLPTGSVTRNPDFTDHRRILQHTPPVELELSIYGPGTRASSRTSPRAADRHGPRRQADGATRCPATSPTSTGSTLDCRIARALGAELVVLHLWELPDGDRYLERNLERLPALLDIAEEHGLTLTVETIPCTVGNPVDNVRRACERDARCRVTLDTEFLAAHGQLDAAHGSSSTSSPTSTSRTSTLPSGTRSRAGTCSRARACSTSTGSLPTSAGTGR